MTITASGGKRMAVKESALEAICDARLLGANRRVLADRKGRVRGARSAEACRWAGMFHRDVTEDAPRQCQMCDYAVR